ncbi:MAG: NUDIX domain-containing protein [Oscillospiraceae bacterium]|nr:NUDIX domain-containing protein [Oscillospiraceae bacterium]
MKYEKSCGAIIFKMDNNIYKLLLIKHKNSGHWSFPKGHIEGNETEIETARREVFEETGVEFLLKDGFREVVRYSPKPSVMKDVVYFLGETKSNKVIIQQEEVSAFKWVSLDDANKIVTFDNDKFLINKACEYLQKKIGA